VRTGDPLAFTVEFEDGPDDIYLTEPAWSSSNFVKFLTYHGVKMVS
jgi:hypothetical protein